MVRFWYYEMKHGVNTSTVRGADKWDEHLDHCWEYLRLGISCGGDLMIEPYSPSPSDATLITGWGGQFPNPFSPRLTMLTRC